MVTGKCFMVVPGCLLCVWRVKLELVAGASRGTAEGSGGLRGQPTMFPGWARREKVSFTYPN